ncbi:MAG: HAMP domain-containing histidine kinase [Gammaproteobacteria bacterium]|nr:HAMP domain-containing histidine kinase [Gammaproteobacteria bacterium]
MKLFKTTAFRVAIQFAASFATLSVITLLSVYYFTIHEMEGQVEKELLHELHELSQHYEKNGQESLVELVKARDQYGQHLHHYYSILSNGRFVAGSEFLITSETVSKYQKSGVFFFDIDDFEDESDDDVIVKYAQKNLSSNLLLLVGQAQNSLTELREHIFTALIYAVFFTVILALFIGTYMGRSVLSRINLIDSGMDKVIESDFTQLLPVTDDEDEFQALTLKLNFMMGKIEKLINGMRQVSDNIAHDLRSPLTRMRSRLEVTLLQNRDEDEYREVMQKVIDDCDELLRTFNSLLAITQAESGVFRDNVDVVDITNLVDELAELYRAVVEDSGLEFIWQKPKKIAVYGSRSSLIQAVNNLLENAIKYTPEGGKVKLEVRISNNRPSIIVSDTGPGIPKKDRQRVLERFQRLDSARSKSGSGLGLSLVNAVVKLHNAKLILSDNNPGLKVEIKFPDAEKIN